MSATDIYDALAPHYREYAERKSAYLAGVDRFILEHAPRQPAALLDVGAGDGVRGMALASAIEAHSVVLADASAEMAAHCRRLGATETWHCEAQNPPLTTRRFDVILCLWNVLGHLPHRAARVQALRALRQLLTKNGSLFFDVNNRHNARSYGRWRVFWRRLVDAVAFDERRGDAEFEWRVGDRIFQAMGHLFTPAEIEGIIAESGMRVMQRVAIDYATGARSRSRRGGQLLYRLG